MIVAPPNARIYLVEQHQLLDLGLDHRSSTEPGRRVHFVDNFLVEPGKTLLPGSKMCELPFFAFEPLADSRTTRDMALEGLKQCTGLTEITAVPVLHRCRAWGAVITHASGWRAVYVFHP